MRGLLIIALLIIVFAQNKERSRLRENLYIDEGIENIPPPDPKDTFPTRMVEPYKFKEKIQPIER